MGIQKFDTEKLREIIKVIRVHSQDEIEIEWNFDDIFSEQRLLEQDKNDLSEDNKGAGTT